MSVEIEEKFLIYENSKEFASKAFFDNFCTIDNLIYEAVEFGENIEQGYLDLKYSNEIINHLGIELKFKPCELRVRKIEKNDSSEYFITFKSDGSITRNEKELPISNFDYDSYFALTKGKRVLKHRLTKKINGLNYEFDVYTDRDLIVCEVEVTEKKELEKIIPMGLDISAKKEYKNKNLAK